MRKEKREKNEMLGYEWETAHLGTKRLMAYVAATAAGKRKMTTDGGDTDHEF